MQVYTPEQDNSIQSINNVVTLQEKFRIQKRGNLQQELVALIDGHHHPPRPIPSTGSTAIIGHIPCRDFFPPAILSARIR